MLKVAEEYLNSNRSEFIAVYGRRRVGKTFFIRQTVGDKACFALTGMENASMKDQLTNFFFTLRKVFPKATQPKSWIEAFDELETYLEQRPKGKKIIVIDELPWLDTVRSKFIAALELFWNGWASARNDIKLIVCGSATSWMIDKIINNLYRSLFKKAGDHINIVTVMASKAKGLTRKQLLELTKLNNNKKFTKNLEELEKCGFIRTYVPFGKTKRDTLFQLTDAFTLFHFHFAIANKFRDESFWTHSINSPRYRAWSGYAFEILCLNHINQIKQALGISGIQSRACCWVGKNEGEYKGAQIDLVIDRADQTVNICEMKFSRAAYEITKSDDANLENKLNAFLSQTKTTKSLMITMITSFGIKRNKYSGNIQNQVVMEDLFN